MIRCYNCMSEFSDEYDMCPFCGTERGVGQKELYFLGLGTVIQDRYEIGMSCGSGGFGITYIAWDRTLAKKVAIKEYYPVGLVNRIPGEKEIIIYSGNRQKEFFKGKQRFLEEAQNMAKFNTHQNIVNVYDFFEENLTAYIVMEFLDGITYKEYMKHLDGPVDIESAIEITNAVLEALSEVHRSGILHRDISPDNVFMTKDGKVNLIDFGAARFSSTEEEVTRSIILKPGFAPPEQYQAKSKQGPWTDIYAVGAMLYRAVTGRVPDESVNRTEQDTLVEPRKFNANISQNLNNVILRAMALQPELRFKDTREFESALNGNGTVKDVRKELKRRQNMRKVSIIFTVFTVVLGILICLSVLQKKKSDAGVLEETNISLWVQIPNERTKEEMELIYKAALTEFSSTYPQVTLSVEYIPEDEYSERILNAQSSDSLPTVFESTNISEEQLTKADDVDCILKYLSMDEYYFLSDYKKYFPEGEKIPTSFSIPVVYINSVLTKADDTATKLLDAGKVVYSDAEGAIAGFLDGNEECLIGEISEYGAVQEKLAGIYRIEILYDTDEVLFCDCYSVYSGATRKEKDAGIQLIVLLLSETSQDVRYVQNGSFLPINKKVFEAYLDVNREFDDLKYVINEMMVKGE